MPVRYWIVVASVLVLFTVFAALLVVSLDWWPDARGEQWQAAATLASLLTTVVAIAGLAAIALVRQQLIRFRQQVRMDIAPNRLDGTWTPVEVDDRYVFDFAAFNPDEGESLVTVLDGWQQEPTTEICLWIQNQQTHPTAVAHNVLVVLDIEVPARSAGEMPLTETYNVVVHYLEPGRTLRYLIGKVHDAIPYVLGRVRTVIYYDLYGTELAFAHGSSEFSWSGESLVNHRNVFRGGEEEGRI